MTLDSFRHPYNQGYCESRLISEIEKYGKLVIGFDFDNTIFDYHNKGGDFSQVIELLQECKELGYTLCLYTLESDPKRLDWKIEYCRHFKIEPDYINHSPILAGTSKPFFNILLDDRAGLEESYKTLRRVINHVKTEFNKSK